MQKNLLPRELRFNEKKELAEADWGQSERNIYYKYDTIINFVLLGGRL